MEFWQVIRFYKKYLLSLLLLSLVISLAAGLAATRLPPSFEATQSIFVRREIQSPSESFYSYDGYYSQQAAERFTDTVVGFLKNKETVRKAAKNSGFGASTEEASRLASALRIKRVAPQLVTVSFSAGRKERAVSLVDNLTGEVDVGSVLEGNDHLGQTELRDGTHHFQARQPADRLLDGEGDLPLDLLGRE